MNQSCHTQQCQILNPLSEGRAQTHILMDTSGFLTTEPARELQALLLMILLVGSLGRAHLGGSSALCAVSWSHSQGFILLGGSAGAGMWNEVLLPGLEVGAACVSTGFSSGNLSQPLTAQRLAPREQSQSCRLFKVRPGMNTASFPPPSRDQSELQTRP